jgi:riboflavin kinase / FMN adenylyltransferase
MRITWLPDAQRRPRRIAVGEFDGVHLGHRAVIEGSDTVLTFEPHPLAVIRPEAAPKLLTTLERKAQLVAQLGVEELVVIPFDQAFSQRSAEQFVDEILIEQLQATHVAVGENFRFGKGARGDTELLRSHPEFETRVVPLVEVEGEVVSSSHIRGLVLAGEVDHAAVFLGAPFQMRGEVVGGDRRGRELGFPTANLVPDQALIQPGHGIYAARASVEGQTYGAAVNVGVRPTFKTDMVVLVEAYLLDFDGDLYGKTLAIDFLARLRGERRFASVDALVEQMQRDVEEARAVYAKAGGTDSATVPRR